MTYGVTPNDKYFAPYLEISEDGSMLWEHSMDEEEVREAINVKSNSSVHVERIINPHFAMFPAWNEGSDINRYFQCQMRSYGGVPGLFNSCERVRKTGRTQLSEKDDIVTFMGNTSLNYFFSGNSTTFRTKAAHVPRPVTGKVDTWQPSYGWNGFTSYPYLWGGTSVGSDVHTLQSTSFFNEDTKLLMNLYQDELDKFE